VARAGRATAGIAALGAALSSGAASGAPELRIDGKRLRGRDWSYDRRADVLEASFTGRSPTLVASERGCR
jgi:hypothetical protein